MKQLNLEPETTAWIDFQDCDPFGHLNNTKYLNYIMHARTQQLKSVYGFDIYDHTQKTGNGWVVATTQLAHLAPAKYNETVRIQTRLMHKDKFRIVPEAVMTSEDGERLHAVAWIEFVYVNISRGRPVKYENDLGDFLASICISDFEWAPENFSSRVKEIQKSYRTRVVTI
jgi:YbgC/YbaW family acyl-CoA thioester hydrolase